LTPVGEPDSTVVFKYGGEEGIRQVEFLGAGTEQFLFSTKYQLYQGQFLGKEIKWGPRFYKEINDLIWMASQEQALVLSNSTAYLLDASGMLIDSLVTSHLLSQVAIAPSADRALIASWGRSIYAWDLDNTKQYEVYTAHDGSVSAVAFKEDGQQFVSADTRGELLLWEWGQSRPRRRIRLHQQAIRALRFQGTQVISIGEDFKLKLLHVPTWKEMATYIPFQEEQFLTILPNNYYSASNQRALFENAGFVLQDQIYPLQYIDPQLNRPQEVLRAMLYPNPLLNGVFQQAYEQRLKTLGIVHSDQLRIEIPRVELVGIERLPGITKHKKIELNVTALDLSWGLKSLTVEINNVPQFRFDCSPSKKYLRKKIEVDLARGQNRIEVYANNAKGVRSFPKSIDLQCLNGPSSPKLYLLAIGADQYVHPTLRPLEYPDQDAKKIAELFESGNHYFQDIHLRTLTGEQVTEANIFAAIDAFAQAQADDVLMLVYSGHGLLDKTSNLHLGTYDARFIQGELEQGLPFARLESRLSQLKPHRKLLMLDACFTGVPDQTLKGATEGENASSASADELTDKSPFPLMDPSVLSKQLFVDLSENNYGINVLASTGANAYSYEGSKWSGSVFIGYLIEGLKKGQADENGDGMIFLPELMLYLKREVKEETNGVQSPDWRSKNTLLKFQVW
ncbi:MAG: caspase family protein, partial [Bacteroidota bacterium]